MGARWRVLRFFALIVQKLGIGIALVQGGETGDVRGLISDSDGNMSFTSKFGPGDACSGGFNG